MLTHYYEKLERYLNSDPELGRRLQGFKTFSGTPDGHFRRARREGEAAIARAVSCYPFGGKSHLDGRELIGVRVLDGNSSMNVLIRLSKGKFSVRSSMWDNPALTLEMPKTLFQQALLGRYRWVWLMSLDQIKMTYADDLPHSDWVTILEILVAMQEMVETDAELFETVKTLSV